MRTILLTWNPTQWGWDYLDQSISQVATQGYTDDQWSCGKRRDIDIGDRFFLIRLGSEPRGLVGSGFITSLAFDGPHWEKKRASAGDTAIYTHVRFDAIIKAPAIPISELDQAPFNQVHWHTQSSGILIAPKIAIAIEQLWSSRLSLAVARLPEELAACPVYIEGLGRQVVVNAYERNPNARQKCLDHHGYACSCCGILLAAVYGKIAQEFIHVHHLVPISEIGKSYVVDPIKDLVPVCPTCHAIIHRQNSPLSIGEVKALLAANRRTHAETKVQTA
jgi:5-methylcytosine-specific restriction enzyme A